MSESQSTVRTGDSSGEANGSEGADPFIPPELEWVPAPVADPIPELPVVSPVPGVSWVVHMVTFLVIVVPLLGLVAVPFLLWGWGIHWVDLVLLVTLYFLSAIGITVGYHRLFTHRSFETYTAVKAVFAVLGSMALEGSLFKWVAIHRRHHQYSDTVDDPHTPHHQGTGWLGVLRGAWHAHIGWFFRPDPPRWEDYVKDLKKSPTLRFLDATFLVWVVLGLVIPAAVGGWVQGSWMGALTGLVWGGLVRIFLVHHITWSINSACHLWGSQPYRSRDESRDNPVFGILALGEGWHAAHHAFPTSARHGLRWWQLDVSYYLIRLLSGLGLAWNVRVPSPESIARARKDAAPPPTAGAEAKATPETASEGGHPTPSPSAAPRTGEDAPTE
jgi:stearoyl-CoA desaturase (delta-9 desaturase)